MEQVLRNRCDVFGDSGFVLLLGESGSGKTTFLNILYGLIPFDNGTVSVDGIEYSGQVDRVSFSKKAEYITQDPFFVDFLTMRENLIMVCENQEAVQVMTDRFGLAELLQQYPETLSGGERQRFAVIRSLLKGKKILLLDEPTASLDAENKRIVFEFLTSIRDHVLILCATHDRIAEEYADQVIGFDKDAVQTIRKRTANDSGSDEEQQRAGRTGPALFLNFRIVPVVRVSVLPVPEIRNDVAGNTDHFCQRKVSKTRPAGGYAAVSAEPCKNGDIFLFGTGLTVILYILPLPVRVKHLRTERIDALNAEIGPVAAFDAFRADISAEKV